MRTKSLKASLTRWTGFPKVGSAFQPSLTSRAARETTKLFQDVQPKGPSRYDLQELHLRVGGVWARDDSLDGTSPRDLRQLPWVLFYPPDRNPHHWLGGDSRLIGEYIGWLFNGRRTRSALALLHEFLRVYPTDLRTFDDLRRFLREYLEGSRQPPLPSVRKWQQRCRGFGLLDADKGHGFVQDYLSANMRCSDYLGEAGLDAGLSRSRFLKSGIRTALRTCSRQLTQDAFDNGQLRRLLTLLEFEGKLRFDEGTTRRGIATALLSPFADRPPPAEIKESLQVFFLRHYRDPRLPSGKHKWFDVPDTTRRVVIRWLVERVLEQFFMLLEETAYDRHWRYRAAFWKAFLEEGLIDDIWFALGRGAARLLRNMSRDRTVLQTTGQLQGAQSDQSVLLLRMPGVVIAEWSHSGSCHMWLEGMPGAPKLYERKYHARQVRRPYPYPQEYGARSQRHDGSQTGRWQDAIARWLRENTDLRVDRNLYFPRELRASPSPSPRGRAGMRKSRQYHSSYYWRR